MIVDVSTFESPHTPRTEAGATARPQHERNRRVSHSHWQKKTDAVSGLTSVDSSRLGTPCAFIAQLNLIHVNANVAVLISPSAITIDVCQVRAICGLDAAWQIEMSEKTAVQQTAIQGTLLRFRRPRNLGAWPSRAIWASARDETKESAKVEEGVVSLGVDGAVGTDPTYRHCRH